MAAWKRVGTPELAFFATFLNNSVKREAEDNRPEHRVNIESPEAHRLRFCGGMGQTPGAIRMLTKGQILQMVPDVFAGGQFAGCDMFGAA